MIDYDGQCTETMPQTKFKLNSLLFLKKMCFECQGHKIAEEANVTNIYQMFLLLNI